MWHRYGYGLVKLRGNIMVWVTNTKVRNWLVMVFKTVLSHGLKCKTYKVVLLTHPPNSVWYNKEIGHSCVLMQVTCFYCTLVSLLWTRPLVPETLQLTLEYFPLVQMCLCFDYCHLEWIPVSLCPLAPFHWLCTQLRHSNASHSVLTHLNAIFVQINKYIILGLISLLLHPQDLQTSYHFSMATVNLWFA